MAAKSHEGMEEEGTANPLDLKRWQKIQDLFSKIIRANVSFFDSHGNYLVSPSKVTSFCSDLVLTPSGERIPSVDCVIKALQAFDVEKKSYHCSHRLSFYSVDASLGSEVFGILVIGPLMVGKREDEKLYRKMCEDVGCDPENFLDGIREIRVFSQTDIHLMCSFLEEILKYFLRLNYQQVELERLMPGFLSRLKQKEKLFAALREHEDSELVHSLLDVALRIVDGDSGSVLFFDQKEKCFHIKTARGISPEVLTQGSIPSRGGIAGWVAKQRRPMLIQKEVEAPFLRGRLNRPEIHSSIVVPMQYLDQTLGVFCVNAQSDNKKFNEDNLVLLDQLGKLASIAFSGTVSV